MVRLVLLENASIAIDFLALREKLIEQKLEVNY